MNEITYYVSGMHCASCELVLEKTISDIKGVTFVDASLASKKIKLRYESRAPSLKELNTLFKRKGYIFSEKPDAIVTHAPSSFSIMIAVASALLVVIGLRLFGPATGIDARGPLAAFFALGVLAGSSSCAALLGGIVISLSQRHRDAFMPHISFHAGRVMSLGLAGALLGALGSSIQLSYSFVSIITIVVSIVMVIVALQMLGIESAHRIRLALPKSFSKKSTSRTSAGPFALGFATVLLPCGFTLAAEGAAILSGNSLRGALIMIFFTIGVALPLVVVGMGSAKLFAEEKRSESLQKIAGVIILALVIYNLSLSFLPLRAPTPLLPPNETSTASTTQKLTTTFTLQNDIQPHIFSARVGEPVEFSVDVRDNGVGCMSTIMIPGLFDSPIYLKKNVPLVMRFTPEKPGTYQITCAMGVPRGILKVTE